MENSVDPVSVLSEDECWERLGSHELGRLVTRVGDVLDIFPVNYVIDRRGIVFRTAEGNKLTELTINDQVLFEVDEYSVVDAWSVVVRGGARVLEGDEGIAADDLPLAPMVPTMKRNYVRIEPTSVTGRMFHRGAEPERDGVQEY